MKKVPHTLIRVALPLLVLTACSEGVDTQGNMQGMEQRRDAGQPGAHMAEGTVDSIAPGGATVSIAHGPVESIGWPAMTMSFRLADPGAAASLTPGQRVEFEFETGGTAPTITRIAPAQADE